MSTSSRLVDRERHDLADLLAELGPDAPTCCAGWTTAHLAAPVVVRDRRLDAMPGFRLERLSPAPGAWAHRAEGRLRQSAHGAVVAAQGRAAALRGSPRGWPGVGPLVN